MFCCIEDALLAQSRQLQLNKKFQSPTDVKTIFSQFCMPKYLNTRASIYCHIHIYQCTGVDIMVCSRLHEYEEETLRSPPCCRQENATFSPHIHRIWGPPFRPSLYIRLRERYFQGPSPFVNLGGALTSSPLRLLREMPCQKKR